MKKISVLSVLALVAVSYAAKTQVPHTVEEVKPYIEQAMSIQERKNKLDVQLDDNTIQPTQAIEETKKLQAELKGITPPWEFVQYHKTLVEFFEKKQGQYELMRKGLPVPQDFSDTLRDLAKESIRELMIAMGKLDKDVDQ
ncbi:hypothetical protein ACFL1E_03070 [Candidatus Omnitrophota bacterium]